MACLDIYYTWRFPAIGANPSLTAEASRLISLLMGMGMKQHASIKFPCFWIPYNIRLAVDLPDIDASPPRRKVCLFITFKEFCLNYVAAIYTLCFKHLWRLDLSI